MIVSFDKSLRLFLALVFAPSVTPTPSILCACRLSCLSSHLLLAFLLPFPSCLPPATVESLPPTPFARPQEMTHDARTEAPSVINALQVRCVFATALNARAHVASQRSRTGPAAALQCIPRACTRVRVRRTSAIGPHVQPRFCTRLLQEYVSHVLSRPAPHTQGEEQLKHPLPPQSNSRTALRSKHALAAPFQSTTTCG